MSKSYYYKGKRYTKKPLKVKLKRLASRVWESMHGGHPGGAQALVERMIREYPGKTDKIEKREPVQTGEKEETGDTEDQVKLMW